MTILRHMFFRSLVLLNRLDFSVRSLRSSGYRGGHFVANAPIKPGEGYINLPIVGSVLRLPRRTSRRKTDSWNLYLPFFNVVKYHLGKDKLERVGQRSSPTSVCDLRGGPQGFAGLLVCPFASVALHCSFAC